MAPGVHIVIMAGGVGSRLYPLSTPEHPKQFIDLLEVGKTMIQLTYERLKAVEPDAVFWVVTGERYRKFALDQLPEVKPEHILCEPEPRNTAPCVALVSWKIHVEDPDARVVFTPADAFVPDIEGFARSIRVALEGVERRQEALVCIGITPTCPHTGYGYIKSSKGASSILDSVIKIDSFKEKPDEATAKQYLAQGGYYWNGGIFIWRNETIISSLEQFTPQICSVIDDIAKDFGAPKEDSAIRDKFGLCEKISIDYAVMEKSSDVYFIPVGWFWSDIGSLEALQAVKKLMEGNKIR